MDMEFADAGVFDQEEEAGGYELFCREGRERRGG